jgi:hypothetical protein
MGIGVVRMAVARFMIFGNVKRGSPATAKRNNLFPTILPNVGGSIKNTQK